MIKKVWEKATVSNNLDPNEYRLDVCGALMRFSHYGDLNEMMGWQIDCIKPIECGGDLNFYNLQPLNCKNKASKKNNYPSWNCCTNNIE